MYVSQAIVSAQTLLSQRRSFSRAVVDRFDGLVLVGPEGNWHFNTPLCGYVGESPMTTAAILELFGFGKKETIYQTISKGDDGATYTLLS